MSETSLRAALIGTGTISLCHLKAWQNLGVPVVALCDRDIGKAADRAAEFGVKRVCEDAASPCADGGFELVDMATSVDAHAPLTRMAADHGVHVMLQEPMTETVADAEALVEDVGGRVRFMVHENCRFRPHCMTVRRWLDESRIGRPRHAAITVRGSGLCPRPGTVPFQVERQPYLKEFGRNLVFETMIHHLDVLRLLAGPLEVVASRLNRLAEGLPGEGSASTLMAGPDGLTASADGCICAPGYPPLHGDRLEIVGSMGTIVMDHDRICPAGAESEAVEVDLLGRYQDCFDHAAEEFMHGVRDGASFETDRLDNLEALRLMESVHDAAGVEV